MEAITEGINNVNISSTNSEPQKKNRIQVSNTKKSLFFYVNLSKRYLQQYNEVELSALGMAISTVVTVAEILKNNGFAIEKKIRTLTVDMRDEPGSRPVSKARVTFKNFAPRYDEPSFSHTTCTTTNSYSSLPVISSKQKFSPLSSQTFLCSHFLKIEIVLGKTEKFDELMAAEAEQAGGGEEQQN
nr:uncharacterized protein At2g34160-like [Ipomoea trifida]GMD47557.1 uncharacterized protein At2g34160-like [Ipomoea batatas]